MAYGLHDASLLPVFVRVPLEAEVWCPSPFWVGVVMDVMLGKILIDRFLRRM